MKHIGFAMCVLGLVLSGRSVAHHSTNLGYDVSAQERISGTFIDFRWINPHAILRLSRINAAGEEEIWSAETHGAAVLGRFGWRPQMFQPGQSLTLMGNPSRTSDSKTFHMLSATTEEGTTYSVNEPIE